MHTLSQSNPDLINELTLAELRRTYRTPDGARVSQTALANLIGRGRSTVAYWEAGEYLAGVNTGDVVAIAAALGCKREQIVTVIENTKKLKQENQTLCK